MEKKIIFADKYEDIFSDSITADNVLLAYKLFEKIESDKQISKEELIKGVDDNEKSSYISYASYWILFLLGELADLKGIPMELKNINEIYSLRKNVLKLIEFLIIKEKEFISNKNDIYSHITFFKYNRPKKLYEDMSMKELKDFLDVNETNEFNFRLKKKQLNLY